MINEINTAGKIGKNVGYISWGIQGMKKAFNCVASNVKKATSKSSAKYDVTMCFVDLDTGEIKEGVLKKDVSISSLNSIIESLEYYEFVEMRITAS